MHKSQNFYIFFVDKVQIKVYTIITTGKQRIREIQKNAVPNKYVETCEDKPVMLFDWMDEFYTLQKNRGLRQLGAITRAKRFLTLYTEDIALNKIDKAFCIGFSNFLKTGYKTSNGACLSPKSGFNILSEVSTAINTAVRNDIIKSNPFTQLTPSEKIQPVEAVREYLTIDEVKELIKTSCEKPIVKQAFLFSCNCGLRLTYTGRTSCSLMARGESVCG